MEKLFIPFSDQLFRKYLWFFIASTALVIAGYCISEVLTLGAFLLVLWINLIGVFLIYRINDCFAQHGSLMTNVIEFLKRPLHLILTLQLIMVVMPLSILVLPRPVLYILNIMALLGVLYCTNIRLFGRQFRFKDIFFVKNIMIGLAWGGLVLIGGAVTNDVILLSSFLVASVQVTIGGIIRDIPDIDFDRERGVRTLPVVLGLKTTMRFLHVLNASLLFLAMAYASDTGVILFSVIVVGWRFINLWLLERNYKVVFFSQWMNLFTCVIFLMAALALTYYGII